jgi:hypothetical protein
MKTIILAAAGALVLLGGAAQAEPTTGSPYSVNEAQEAALQVRTHRSAQAANELPADPTGLPAYELRSNGLLTNGLLPANGWQG